jgi:CheY-like chemotaxis protein
MTRILIIDDEPYVRAFMRQALERAGYVVSEAANGCEGLRLYTSLRPDCVITDLYMPEKEGLESITEMRQHAHRARIIAISGGVDAYLFSFLKAAKQLGADAVLSKPFSAEALLRQLGQFFAEVDPILVQ